MRIDVAQSYHGIGRCDSSVREMIEISSALHSIYQPSTSVSVNSVTMANHRLMLNNMSGLVSTDDPRVVAGAYSCLWFERFMSAVHIYRLHIWARLGVIL